MNDSPSGLRDDAAPDGPVLRVLGSIALVADGREARVERSMRTRRILAALVINGGRLVTADRLADAAWPDALPQDPRAALHNLISRLRALLRDVPGIELLTRSPGYVLSAARSSVDATVFEDQVRAARDERDPHRSLARMEAALALWRGPAYAEFADEEFARAEAGRLAALYRAAQEDMIDTMLTLGLTDRVVSLAKQAISGDPFHERSHVQLITALYRQGRVAEALESYRAYRDLTRGELGLEPGQALRDLEGRIMRRDEALEPASRPEGPAAGLSRLTFLGREADLAAIADLLASRQLVTLAGPGGVGKTRLAVQLCRQLTERYPDGVILCELSSLSDGSQVAELIASRAGILPGPADDLPQQLASVLSTRQSLLVLDNCEHVLEPVVALVEQLLGASPVRILATCREPLGVPGEQVWRVEPLPVPSGDDCGALAAQLFVDRARLVEPSFEPTHGLAELCRRLDGLPLAIELAAARMNSMTVQEVLRRLDQQPEIVASSRRTGSARHRSLTAVVDWSYRLLDGHQQSVFDQLAVFPDDFSLDAATAIVRARLPPGDIAATILDLVDRSLVQHIRRDGASRYSLLETLRRYGRQHLRSRDELAALRTRHATWYTQLAGEFGAGLGSASPGWIRQLDGELPNLRAACEWLTLQSDRPGLLRLIAPLQYYALWGLNPEVFDWARAAIGLAGGQHGPDPLLSVAYAIAAHGCWLTGDLAQSREYAERSIACAGPQPIARHGEIALANALAPLGHHYEIRADLYHRAAISAKQAGALAEHVHAMILYSACLMKLGQGARAEQLAQQMLGEAERLGAADLAAKARLCVADISMAQDPMKALHGYWDVADLNAGLGNRYGEFQALLSAAFAEILYGKAECAVAVFRSLLTKWSGLPLNTAHTCLLPGVVILAARAGRYREAATLSGAIPADAPMVAFTIDDNVITTFAELAGKIGGFLGAAELAALRETGRGMPRQDIYALALDVLGSIVLAGAVSTTPALALITRKIASS